MKRIVAVTICTVFLLSGLIRIGVGGLMMGQAAGLWAIEGEATEALAETKRFVSERDVNIVGFTPITYFGFIAFMGLVISMGAVGQLRRKRWGLVLICLYIVCHAFLFVNFMTVNPKLLFLVLASVMTGVLWWAGRGDGSGAVKRQGAA
ncbi:MAG: hypothetical protein AAFS02_16710 [Pseudomonadota bacterium]